MRTEDASIGRGQAAGVADLQALTTSNRMFVAFDFQKVGPEILDPPSRFAMCVQERAV